MASDGDEGRRVVAQRVDGEEDEHDRRHRDRCHGDHGVGAGLGAPAVAGERDEHEDRERDGAADRRDRGQVDEVGHDEHERGRDQQPDVGAARRVAGRRTAGTARPRPASA